MKLSLKSGHGLVFIVLAVAALAVAFWMLLLGPKREEASKLGAEVEQVEASLAQHRQEVAFAAEARASFPDDYRRLVVLGKAVPGDDDTASFLVQVNRIAESAGVDFRVLELSEGSASAEATPPPAEAAASTGTPVSATEAAASVLPLGASVGPAGLAVMPYTLTFDGSFFEIADFIKGMDKLVETKEGTVAVDGRLVTIDGFDLSAAPSESFPALEATFTVTTYLTPPSQGATGEATLESPPASSAAPVATTTGAAP